MSSGLKIWFINTIDGLTATSCSAFQKMNINATNLLLFAVISIAAMLAMYGNAHASKKQKIHDLRGETPYFVIAASALHSMDKVLIVANGAELVELEMMIDNISQNFEDSDTNYRISGFIADSSINNSKYLLFYMGRKIGSFEEYDANLASQLLNYLEDNTESIAHAQNSFVYISQRMVLFGRNSSNDLFALSDQPNLLPYAFVNFGYSVFLNFVQPHTDCARLVLHSYDRAAMLEPEDFDPAKRSVIFVFDVNKLTPKLRKFYHKESSRTAFQNFNSNIFGEHPYPFTLFYSTNRTSGWSWVSHIFHSENGAEKWEKHVTILDHTPVLLLEENSEFKFIDIGDLENSAMMNSNGDTVTKTYWTSHLSETLDIIDKCKFEHVNKANQRIKILDEEIGQHKNNLDVIDEMIEKLRK